MFSTVVSAALLGAAAVNAAPWGPLNSWGPPEAWPSHTPTATTAPQAAQTPFSFPLANGFPNESPAALNATEVQAQGTLPNSGLPKSLSATSIATFSLIAFNELFEVAFFTSLVNNITTNVPGYELRGEGLKNFILRTLNAVVAQEELHAIGANGVLQSAGAQPIAPCKYIFPTDNFEDAIALAATFTDLVLGTLQDAQNNLATDGDAVLVPLVGSVIGQEGEQTGYYRTLGGKIPSELPFLTRSAGAFANSALHQVFVVPGSCPKSVVDTLPVFGVLNVVTMASAKDQLLTFSFQNTNNVDVNSLSLVLINQQNLPIVEKLQNVQTSGQKVTFQANFPYTANLLNGLTIAAVTSSAGPFASVPDVAGKTLFGPGLIEVN